MEEQYTLTTKQISPENKPFEDLQNLRKSQCAVCSYVISNSFIVTCFLCLRPICSSCRKNCFDDANASNSNEATFFCDLCLKDQKSASRGRSSLGNKRNSKRKISQEIVEIDVSKLKEEFLSEEGDENEEECESLQQSSLRKKKLKKERIEKISNMFKFINCHQCKKIEETNKMLVCSEVNCRESFCHNCLKRISIKNNENFNPNKLKDLKEWKCLLCREICPCKSCSLKRPPQLDKNIFPEAVPRNSIVEPEGSNAIVAAGSDVEDSMKVKDSGKPEGESIENYIRIADVYKESNSTVVYKRCIICDTNKFPVKNLKKFKSLKGFLYYVSHLFDTNQMKAIDNEMLKKNKDTYFKYFEDVQLIYKSDYKFRSAKNICLKCIEVQFNKLNGFNDICQKFNLPENFMKKREGDNLPPFKVVSTPKDGKPIPQCRTSFNFVPTFNSSQTILSKKSSGIEVTSAENIHLINNNAHSQPDSGNRKYERQDSNKSITDKSKLELPLLNNQKISLNLNTQGELTPENCFSLIQSIKNNKTGNYSRQNSNAQSIDSRLFTSLAADLSTTEETKTTSSIQYLCSVQKSFISLILSKLVEFSEQIYDNQIITEIILANLSKQIPNEQEKTSSDSINFINEQFSVLKKLNSLGMNSCSNLKLDLEDIKNGGYSFLFSKTPNLEQKNLSQNDIISFINSDNKRQPGHSLFKDEGSNISFPNLNNSQQNPTNIRQEHLNILNSLASKQPTLQNSILSTTPGVSKTPYNITPEQQILPQQTLTHGINLANYYANIGYQIPGNGPFPNTLNYQNLMPNQQFFTQVPNHFNYGGFPLGFSNLSQNLLPQAYQGQGNTAGWPVINNPQDKEKQIPQSSIIFNNNPNINNYMNMNSQNYPQGANALSFLDKQSVPPNQIDNFSKVLDYQLFASNAQKK